MIGEARFLDEHGDDVGQSPEVELTWRPRPRDRLVIGETRRRSTAIAVRFAWYAVVVGAVIAFAFVLSQAMSRPEPATAARFRAETWVMP